MEEYEPEEDIISICSNVCEKIDELSLASFLIKTDQEILLPKTDFKYDFTSIIPELLDLVDFLTNKNGNEFVLFLYERDIKIKFVLDLRSDKDILISIIKNTHHTLIKTYTTNNYKLIRSLKDTLDTFEKIVFSFFPVALKIFRKNKYLNF